MQLLCEMFTVNARNSFVSKVVMSLANVTKIVVSIIMIN